MKSVKIFGGGVLKSKVLVRPQCKKHTEGGDLHG